MIDGNRKDEKRGIDGHFQHLKIGLNGIIFYCCIGVGAYGTKKLMLLVFHPS
jgi:hypothetical protein